MIARKKPEEVAEFPAESPVFANEKEDNEEYCGKTNYRPPTIAKFRTAD